MIEFKRMRKGRKKEAERAKKSFDSSDIQNLKNKLGLSQRENEARVIRELNRIRNKPRTIKALKLTIEDFKKFGITPNS